jgi:hypothetical protein
MIGLVLTPIFSLEYNVNFLIARVTNRLSRIFFVEESLVQTSARALTTNVKELSSERNILDPATLIKVEAIKPQKNSSLSKVDDLLILKGKAQWAASFGETEETVVSCIYKPEQKEKP